MQNEKVLVFDSNGVFLKMFKRKLKERLDFTEASFSGEIISKEFDRVVFVIYNHNELMQFLSQERKETNILVCLFNVQLYRSLSFLEITNNLILFDESKTRIEILKEINAFFDSKPDCKAENISFRPSQNLRKKNQEYYKAMYFLM